MAESSRRPRVTVGINMGFGEAEFGNRVFDEDYPGRDRNPQVWRFMRDFRTLATERGIDLATIDQVDFESASVPYVIYFDFSWRRLVADRFLFRIPREKRVLLMLEPSNINPSLHFIPAMRRPFSKIFTFNDEQALRCGYTKINYFVLGDMLDYRTPPFERIPFERKRKLIGINSNRWAYMPSSTYSIRKRFFRFFEQRYPSEFDLFGHGWNRPCVFYERWFGYPRFTSYRGEIPEDIVSKIRLMSGYRFHLCIENNKDEPGYVSEKITDCFCARCVPLYLGWRHADRYIPRECFVNLRDFRSIEELGQFIDSVDEARYQVYLDAIETFIHSEKARYFTNANAFDTIWSVLFPHGIGPRNSGWQSADGHEDKR